MGGILAKTSHQERREQRLADCRGTDGMPIALVRVPHGIDEPYPGPMEPYYPTMVVDPGLQPINESDEDDQILSKNQTVAKAPSASWWNCGCLAVTDRQITASD